MVSTSKVVTKVVKEAQVIPAVTEKVVVLELTERDARLIQNLLNKTSGGEAGRLWRLFSFHLGSDNEELWDNFRSRPFPSVVRDV